MLARGAVGAGFIAGVAAPAHSARQKGDPLARLGQIEQHGFAVFIRNQLGADRHLDQQVLAGRTVAVLARAMTAARGFEMLGIAEVDQGIEPRHRFDNDIAALAAIAAVRAAVFDVHFTSERHRPGAALARTDEDFGLIKKMHGGLLTGYGAIVARDASTSSA